MSVGVCVCERGTITDSFPKNLLKAHSDLFVIETGGVEETDMEKLTVRGFKVEKLTEWKLNKQLFHCSTTSSNSRRKGKAKRTGKPM